MRRLFVCLIVGITMLAACSQESSFTEAPPESSSVKDDSDSDGGDQGSNGELTATSDTDSSISDVCAEGQDEAFKWPDEIQSCFDSGGFYHFETTTCFQFQKAISPCTWDTILAKLDENGLQSELLKKEKESGSKIVSCSESNNDNGYFFSVQSISVDNLEKVSCDGLKNGAGIFTGCYASLAGGQKGIDSSSPANSVKDCSERGSK